MKNTLRKNFMIVLIAVLALGFSVFFTACHSSLNEEDDNKHVETPGGEEENLSIRPRRLSAKRYLNSWSGARRAI